MRDRRKAFTLNISGFRAGVFFLLAVSVLTPAAHAADPVADAITAVVDKVEEKSTPLLEAASKAEPAPGASTGTNKKHWWNHPKKSFYNQLQNDRRSFYDKEQKKKYDFLQKLRTQNLTDEERQQKLADFNAKQIERRQKFAEKMNKKIIQNAQAATQ